ncbi:hypothetical protein GJ496_000140 [Pomphorhynchus laevis]|nr:hypothetical protein GJ496_000140 [Pomphorhynchus laevis]
MDIDSSGAVKLIDLDDYINPSQNCVKNIAVMEKSVNKRRNVIKKPVKIQLSDCLSCSGCITSSESVLIGKQLWKLVDNHMSSELLHSKCTVCVAEQSISSIADAANISPVDVITIIDNFFNTRFPTCSPILVYPLNPIRLIVQTALAKQFTNMYDTSVQKLPLITSACPGWICYAEKTHDGILLPYISTICSPQQAFANLHNPKDSSLHCYSVSIMPCYDKKLECSRPQFKHMSNEQQQLDASLTTTELIEMMRSYSDKSSLLDEFLQKLDNNTVSKEFESTNNQFNGSGGYLNFTLDYFARNVLKLKEFNVTRTNLRGKNLVEVTIDGYEDVKFLYAYGFRSIYHVVRQIKSKKCKYHFIEIMACPGGCLNGNGQLSSKSNGLDAKYIEALSTIDHNVYDSSDYDSAIMNNIHTTYTTVTDDSVSW